jgi:hypothetical protein
MTPASFRHHHLHEVHHTCHVSPIPSTAVAETQITVAASLRDANSSLIRDSSTWRSHAPLIAPAFTPASLRLINPGRANRAQSKALDPMRLREKTFPKLFK